MLLFFCFRRGGRFSSAENRPPLRLRAGWRDGFEGIPESERPTLPEDERYPPATFDHLFWKGLRKPLDRRVGRFLPRVSDHAPIYVSFPVGSRVVWSRARALSSFLAVSQRSSSHIYQSVFAAGAPFLPTWQLWVPL